MDKIKKMIVFLIVLILLISVILVMLIKHNKEKLTSEQLENNPKESVKLVTDKNTFFSIKSCVEKYYMILGDLWIDNNSSQVFSSEDKAEGLQISTYSAQQLYNLLGKEYIVANNITVDNIGDTFKFTDKKKTITNEILSYQSSKDLTIYLVKGYNWIYKQAIQENFELIIVVNKENEAFAIYPTEYINTLGLNNINIGDKPDISNEKFSAIKNNYNQYQKQEISTEEVIYEYVNLYNFNINYNIEQAYESLKEEYRNKKFGNIDEYKKYLKNNLTTIKIQEYIEDSRDGFKEYICITSGEKYFIINEISFMKYSIMLDAYTVDLETFKAKYATASDSKKIGLNIDKIKQAINEKDYTYVYNRLNQTFRSNKYPTEEKLKNYLQEKMFEKNKFSCESIQKSEGTYIIKLKITSAKDESAEAKYINVIMTLYSDTDFEISFGV